MNAPIRLQSLDDAVSLLLQRIPGPVHLAAPLGIGKPHRLLNALYAAVSAQPQRALCIYTALSLDPPVAAGGLQGRFLGPFVARVYGEDFPRLSYVRDLKAGALPANVRIEEFYLQSGAMLGVAQAQRHYASLNYTHVARALANRGVNCVVQKVASNADGSRLSLSSNTDLTFDALDAIAAHGMPRPLLVAEIDPQLPWLDGTATVDAGFFDIVVSPPAPHPRLFALPRQPVADAEYAIGFYASALVRDGGTLQIGIGALADALAHALVLRHVDNAAYRRVLRALDPDIESHPAVRASGGLEPFATGLYGCSEMVNEGFRALVQAGVIRRKVVDDEALMRRVNAGEASADDQARIEREGEYLHGAFYLGSPEFYDWLHGLDDGERRGISMRRVAEVNELYGGRESLEREQRAHARFFNTCMMATALGAAVSDALADGRVVSGVGGQYNFVAMAHALRHARSVLMLRATRDTDGKSLPSVLWQYGHTTIPRHLRDVYVSEYGIADVLGRVDEDCVAAMLGIADAAHQPALLEQAKGNAKLSRDFAAPAQWQRNTPRHVQSALAPFRADGTLPDYPLGSDFTAVEQRVVRTLQWLKAATATRGGKLRTIGAALLAGTSDDAEAMARMQFAAPAGLAERLEARLLALGLRRTA
ncbi:MAG TPA: acetyl-CoA hydrolase/transferase C-terminal domain-containing protein [Thermomonas sp.]|nr:acetyl-CoA hydrolase/transferase C-terminal domain-containing protein [Thermomonas sp.]